MNPEWKDTTRQRGKSGMEWTLQFATFNVVVHHHIYYGDKWLVSCLKIGLDQHVLESKDIEDAKKEALGVVMAHLAKSIDDLNSMALELKASVKP